MVIKTHLNRSKKSAISPAAYTDAGFLKLKSLRNLREIKLYSVNITDKGIEVLDSFPTIGGIMDTASKDNQCKYSKLKKHKKN